MNATRTALALSALTIAHAASAQDHFHMTVDTAPVMGVPTTLIRAGYLPAENSFTVEDGRLMFQGEVAVLVIPDQISSGTFSGYFGGQQAVLTSDFFFSTGRLTGGNFNFEIADVQTIAGPPTRVVWVHATGPSSFSLQADSNGASQGQRSYNVGIAGHQHAQLTLIRDEGLYDVTFIAWDTNGVYAPSEPVTVRFQAGEPVICPADTNGDGQVAPNDFSAWIAAFNAQSPACDQNGDGQCTPADFSAWIANFNAGC
jgi:hypothetical protein